MFIILKGRKHFGVNKKPPNLHSFSKLPKEEKGEKQIIQIKKKGTIV